MQCLEKSDILPKCVKYAIKGLKNAESESNPSVCGVIEMLACLIPIIKEELFPRLQTIYSLLVISLFGNIGTSNGSTKIFQGLCQEEEIRKKAFKLLSAIAIKVKIETDILQTLLPFHLAAKWRTKESSNWFIESTPFTKSQTGYVGLVNMGSTCYVNSLIQQLYFIPEFRNSITALNSVGLPGSALREFQQVMGALNQKLYGNYQPKAFCEAMEVSPSIQRDVSEFLDQLFEKLKESLSQTDQKGLINSLFEIPLASETICMECNNRYERISPPAYAIHIEIKNKKSILESLKAFVQPEMMQGDNAYYCSNCEKKVCASRREFFKVLPNILFIHLKRFEFNFDSTTTKLNSYCEFPMDLDMEEFSDTSDVMVERLPKQYYKYKLKGIIAHTGLLNSGHYYSFIEDTEKKEPAEDYRWFEFNDSDVKPFNVKEIPEKAFGYKEEKSLDPNIPSEWMVKSNNAYILIYQRSVMLPSEVLSKIMSGDDYEFVKQKIESKENAFLKANGTPSISEDLRKRLDEERNNKLVQQIVFHPEYAKFILRLMKHPGISEEIRDRKEYISNQLFLVTYFFTTAIRGNEIDEINELQGVIKTNCQKEIGLCKAIATLFTNQLIIREFIIDCPKVEARVFTFGLLKVVIQKLYSEEQEAVDKYLTKNEYLNIDMNNENAASVKANDPPFLALLIDAFVLAADKISKKNCGQYFHVLSVFAGLGDEPKKYLTYCLMPGVVLEVLGISNKTDCIKNVIECLPHFVGKGELFIRTLNEDIPINDPNQDKTKNIANCEYALVLFRDLLKTTFKIEDDIEYKKPKFADLMRGAMESLKIDTSFRQLFDIASTSKKALNCLSSILLQLCELKNEIYGLPILTYLSFKLNDANVKDIRLFLRPAFFILQSEDQKLASVFLNFLYFFYRKALKKSLEIFAMKCRKQKNFLI